MAEEAKLNETKIAKQTSISSRLKSDSIAGEEPWRLFWSLDPADRDLALLDRVIQTIRNWTRALDAEVIPISVIPRANLPWPENPATPLKELLLPKAEANVALVLERAAFESPAKEKAIFLFEEGASRREAVRLMVDRARMEGARLLVAATHGRTGFDRVRIGSFTETLIATSDLPVLVVNPHTVSKSKSEYVATILIPTDYSDAAKSVFTTALRFASRLGAKLVLLHVNDLSFRTLAFAGEWGVTIDPALLDQAWRDEDERMRLLSERWTDLALSEGVEARSVFASEAKSLERIILDTAAAEGADLIAMATYAGPLEQALLGSVARDVIHEATCPILVVRSSDSN